MKRFHALTAGLLLGLAAAAPAADVATFTKAYFGSTKPGSWAKYEQISTDPKGKVQKTEVTLSRLEGEGSRVWLEMRSVPKEGAKGKPTTIRYLLNTDFDVEKNALDYLKYVEKLVMQEDGKEAMEYPAEMLRQVGAAFASNVDYGASVAPLGPCASAGRTGEKYRMQGSFEVNLMIVKMKGTTDTELCLSDAVPFGRLSERTVTTSDKGKPMGTTEMLLLDSGTGATSAIKGTPKKMEMPALPWGG